MSRPAHLRAGHAGAVSTIKLNDDNEIRHWASASSRLNPRPRGGAGALEIGYRHIDTAEMYGNEKEADQTLLSRRPRSRSTYRRLRGR